jgi:hypothetical protein
MALRTGVDMGSPAALAFAPRSHPVGIVIGSFFEGYTSGYGDGRTAGFGQGAVRGALQGNELARSEGIQTGFQWGFLKGLGAGEGLQPVASALVIAAVSPTPSTAPGAAGGMPAIYADAAVTPIVISVTSTGGASAIAFAQVTALFLDGSAEAVYRTGGFVGDYVTGSSQAGLSTGLQLTLRRDGGWPGAAVGGNLAVGIRVDAVNTDGTVFSSVFYYQMPPTVLGFSPEPEIVDTGARDFATLARSFLVWQFRSA